MDLATVQGLSIVDIRGQFSDKRFLDSARHGKRAKRFELISWRTEASYSIRRYKTMHNSHVIWSGIHSITGVAKHSLGFCLVEMSYHDQRGGANESQAKLDTLTKRRCFVLWPLVSIEHHERERKRSLLELNKGGCWNMFYTKVRMYSVSLTTSFSAPACSLI